MFMYWYDRPVYGPGQSMRQDPILRYDHVSYVADRDKMFKSKVDPISKGQPMVRKRPNPTLIAKQPPNPAKQQWPIKVI